MQIFSSFSLICAVALLFSCGKGTPLNITPQDELFITFPATDSLAVINPNQTAEITRLKVGKLPHNMRLSADGSKVYIVLVGSQAIAEVDTESKELIRTFLTAPTPMTNSDGSEIEPHISQQADEHKSCFDCHNGKTKGAKPAVVGTRPFGIALTPDNQLLVANTLDATVNFIDLSTGEITKSLDIDASGDAKEPTELAIMGDVLYVTVRPVLPSSSASVLRSYDLKSHALLSETEVGSAVTALHSDIVNKLLFTTNFESNTLDKMGSDGQLIESFTVGNGPFGLDLKNEDLFVANYYNNSISKINLADKTVKTQVLEKNGQYFSNPTHINHSWNGEKLYLISAGTKGYLLTLENESLAIMEDREIDGLPFDVLNITNGVDSNENIK